MTVARGIVRDMARHRHHWDPVCDPPKRLVRPVPLDPTGLSGPTRGQARSSKWRSASRGLYLPASVDSSLPEQRVLEASVLLPPGGAVTGWAALRLMRGSFFDGLMPDGATERPVMLAVGRDLHRTDPPGVRYSRAPVERNQVIVRQGIPCVLPERAVFDEMGTTDDLREAVVVMDMAAAADITSINRVRTYVDRRTGCHGAPLARQALELADENSRSPNESRMRLTWVLDAELPRPLVNREVFDRATGRLLGVADLLDEEAGLVGEYDGGEHAGARRRSKDAGRDGLFRDHGLEVFRVTAVDLASRRAVVDRALAARRRATWLPRHLRTWTIQPPEHWEPAPSLDEILDRRDLVRELHEGWDKEPGLPLR